MALLWFGIEMWVLNFRPLLKLSGEAFEALLM